MAVDERARRHLHERLDETIGREAADVLMEELALLGREQLATRHDVELLRRDMAAGFDRTATRTQLERLRGDLHERLNAQRDHIDANFRQLLFWMVGMVLTVAALAFGAAQLG